MNGQSQKTLHPSKRVVLGETPAQKVVLIQSGDAVKPGRRLRLPGMYGHKPSRREEPGQFPRTIENPPSAGNFPASARRATSAGRLKYWFWRQSPKILGCAWAALDLGGRKERSVNVADIAPVDLLLADPGRLTGGGLDSPHGAAYPPPHPGGGQFCGRHDAWRGVAPPVAARPVGSSKCDPPYSSGSACRIPGDVFSPSGSSAFTTTKSRRLARMRRVLG